MNRVYNQNLWMEKRRILRKNQTNAERYLWDKLRNRQMFGLRFFRQYSVGIYILDFYCPKKKLAIELDGGQHTEDSQRLYDEKRTRILNDYGIHMLRFWDNDVLTNTQGVLESIAAHLDSVASNTTTNPT